KTENADLQAKLHSHNGQLAKYQTKISDLQKFVAGLGNDFNRVRDDSISIQRRIHNLVLEGSRSEKEREKVQQYLASCMEKSIQVRDDAIKVCTETWAQVQEMNQSKIFLEAQLGEKVGLLAEERDRRMLLEKHLAVTAQTHESIKKLMQQDTQTIVNKILELDITAETAAKDKKNGEMLKECLKLTQALHGAELVTMSDVKKVEDLLKILSDSLSARVEEMNDMRAEVQQRDGSLELRLVAQLAALKTDLTANQALQERNTSLRESNAALEERIKTNDASTSDLRRQLETISAKEITLQDKLIRLEAEVSALKSAPIVSDESLSRLLEADSRNAIMRDELTMLKAELFEGAQKIHQQNVQEESLRGEVENLKKQLKVAEDRVAALSSNEDELVQKTSGVVEKMRANLSKEANRLRTEAVAELENKVHQMAHQKSQADARLANTTSELELSKARLQTLVKETKLKDAEIQTHKRTQASTEQKLQQLQQSLQMSDVSNKEIDAIKENARALEKQVHSKDAELLEAKQSHATNIKKLEELQEVIEKADVTKTALELELDRERGAADRKCKEIQERTATYINQLWQRLESSETNRKDGELLVARMHSQADSALKEQKGKSTLALEELQRRLSEAEADSKENELTHQEYRQEAEEAFKKQQEKYKGEIGEMQRRLSEIEASKRATGASEE
ncbi:hypothetical protein LTR39_003866, partial [Cryomyces antarcticus]